jgi:hypothetical protein
MTEVVKSAIEVSDMLPAVAQGAIGIERRAEDMRAAGDAGGDPRHARPGQRLAAERAFLERARRVLPDPDCGAWRSWMAARCGCAARSCGPTAPKC